MITLDDIDKPLVLLYGDIGYGKTTFIRNLIGDVVTSPTFNKIQEYNIIYNNKKYNIAHIDLYMNTIDEDMIIYYINNFDLIFIEWANLLSDQFKKTINNISTKITFNKNHQFYIH